jgi:hypothetical protein
MQRTEPEFERSATEQLAKEKRPRGRGRAQVRSAIYYCERGLTRTECFWFHKRLLVARI